MNERCRIGWMRAAAVVLGSTLLLAVPAVPAPAGPGVDLSAYYPNTTLSPGFYLDGRNYRPDGTSFPSVLWFENVSPSGSFKLYNAGPYHRCHWDLLRWTATLAYSQTHNDPTDPACGGRATDTVYSPAITFLPKTWDGTPWTQSGRSTASFSENGALACSGTNNWTANVYGWELIDPPTGLMAIHWRTSQTTNWSWDDGHRVAGDCAAGTTTNWQEDYYLIDNLPVTGDPAVTSGKGLKRTAGGNLATSPCCDWDVWFDAWRKLP